MVITDFSERKDVLGSIMALAYNQGDKIWRILAL
jgi:hypothetical protein